MSSTRMTGVIFSDLGAASSFMALDWVQNALKETLGFTPFPATLNVRPQAPADAAIWHRQRDAMGVPLKSTRGGFCNARLFSVEVTRPNGVAEKKVAAAILLPEVKDYPRDKIEIVAPMRLKDHLGVRDGDALTVEFLN